MEVSMSAEKDLLNEVRQSIEKSLPAIQVDVFRRYVDEAEKAKKDYEELVKDHKILIDNHERDTKELNILKYLNLEADRIKKEREDLELNKKRFEIEKQLQTVAVTNANEKVTLVSGLFHDVFRNIEVRRNILGDVPVITKYQNGDQFTSRESSNTFETESKE
jgi:hypothetical protein